MKRNVPFSVMVLTVAFGAAPWVAASGPPVTVSPGGAREVKLIDQRCPTFSWGALAGPTAYELVVYQLPQGIEADLEGAEPLLRERLPGGASSWTPAMERCLSPGGRYAWLVRSAGAEGASDWSEPRLFQVVAGPSAAELEGALAVLQAYLAGGGVELGRALGQVSPAAGTGSIEGPQADEPRAARATEPEGVPAPDVAAVRGQVPDTTGVTFGLYGISASTTGDSSGVVGESTAASGATHGVLGQVQSAAGVAGAFDNTAGGKVLSGRADGVEVFSVDSAGAVIGGSFVGDGSGLSAVVADSANDLVCAGCVSEAELDFDPVTQPELAVHTAVANAHHTPPTTLPPSGAAGGDLSGTFPNPEVVDDSHSHANATVADDLSIDNGRLFAPSGGGNVGIGTTTPIHPLHISGSVAAHVVAMIENTSFFGAAGVLLKTPAAGNHWTLAAQETGGGAARGFEIQHLTNGTVLAISPTTGFVGIGTITPADRLQVAGDIRVGTSGTNGCLKDASGGTIIGTCSSDIRLKKNVTPLGNMLQSITRLTPVHFNWRSEEFPQLAFGDETQLGLIAQEVEGILPELVVEGEDGLKRVRYSDLPLLLLQGLKEQQRENQQLAARVNELSKRLSALVDP